MTRKVDGGDRRQAEIDLRASLGRGIHFFRQVLDFRKIIPALFRSLAIAESPEKPTPLLGPIRL